jgi:hypothetical protein
MAVTKKKQAESDGVLTAKEIKAELRQLGYRLTGSENEDELKRMFHDELNRQWLASASRGKVIRRRRSAT